jgi:hypothetical protein
MESFKLCTILPHSRECEVRQNNLGVLFSDMDSLYHHLISSLRVFKMRVHGPGCCQ